MLLCIKMEVMQLKYITFVLSYSAHKCLGTLLQLVVNSAHFTFQKWAGQSKVHTSANQK